jgi:hypothetical protein
VAAIEAESVFEVFSLLETMEVISSRAACQHLADTDFNARRVIAPACSFGRKEEGKAGRFIHEQATRKISG